MKLYLKCCPLRSSAKDTYLDRHSIVVSQMDTFRPGIFYNSSQNIGLTKDALIAKFRYPGSLPEYPGNKPSVIKVAINSVNHFVLVDIYPEVVCKLVHCSVMLLRETPT